VQIQMDLNTKEIISLFGEKIEEKILMEAMV
jgi:hypothetical protein